MKIFIFGKTYNVAIIFNWKFKFCKYLVINVKHKILVKSPTYSSYPLNTQKRVPKSSVCSKLGIKWLKWGDYTVKIEDNSSMRRGQQWEANWVAHNR
jgi:hypothetical protein